MKTNPGTFLAMKTIFHFFGNRICQIFLGFPSITDGGTTLHGVAPSCSGYHCGTNFNQLSLNLGSAQVQTLLAVYRRFAMVRISDHGPSWK